MKLAALLVSLLAATCDPSPRAAPPSPAPTPEPSAPARPPETAPPDSVPAPSSTPRSPPTASAPLPSAPGPTASAPAPSPPDARVPCRVALVGDSLTDFAAHGGGFVRYLEQRLPGSTFTNFAKGGAMVNQMRRTFESVVLAHPNAAFTHLLVFGGVNDLYSDETAGRTPAKIEADLTAIYRAGKERGWRVIAVSVAPWGGFKRYDNPRRRAATRELNTWILEQPARGTVDVVVDAHSLLGCGDPDVLCSSYEPPHKDGLHFGKGGHEVLGKALFEAEFERCR